MNEKSMDDKLFKWLVKIPFTLFGLYLIGLVIWAANSPDTEPTYLPARGHIYTGVKMYWEGTHEHTFTVEGGNRKFVMPDGSIMNGVKVVYPSGEENWKARSFLESSHWTVRSDDPNVNSGQLQQYAH